MQENQLTKPTQEQVERAQKCTEEVNEILKKYNCTTAALTVLAGNQIQQQVQIVAQSAIVTE